MKLTEREFKTTFFAARLGQESRALDITFLADPEAVNKAIKVSAQATAKFWEQVKDLELADSPMIPADLWVRVVAARAKADQLAEKEHRFFSDRYKKGKNQNLTQPQIKWLASILKRLEA